MPSATRRSHTQLWLALAFAAAAVAWSFPAVAHHYGTPYLRYENSPLPAVSPVQPGHPVLLTVARCSSADHDVKYTFVRTLVNDETHGQLLISNGATTLPPGCATIQSALNLIPADLPPGRYHIDGVSTSPGNWGDYEVPWRTQSFNVARA